MPQGNLGYLIAGLNSLIYGLYLIWPPHNMYNFMNNFTFSMYGFNKGYFWNLLTCHFSHMQFFNFLIDTGITWMLCQNLMQMYGHIYVGRVILLSILMGSSFLALQAFIGGQHSAYFGNDAMLRGLVFSLIFRNPQASLMLFPIPVNIPAWAIGAFILMVDLLQMNTPGFGGVAAAYAMANLL